MIVSFLTKELQEESTCFDQLVQNYGPHQARRIRQRLDELDAAITMADFMLLPAPQCQKLDGERTGQVSAMIDFSTRLILEPVPSHNSHKEVYNPEWSKITKVRILSLSIDI